MDRKEHIAWLNSMEEKYPVNEWQIDNVHIWPLIKVKLSLENFKKSNVSISLSPLSKKKQFLKILKGFYFFCQLFFKKKNKRPMHIYCLASHFRYNHDQNLINRYFNQLIEKDINSKRSYKILDYSNASTEYSKKIDFFPQTIFLDKLKYFALALRKLKLREYKNSTQNWRGFDSFLIELNSKSSKSTLTRSSVVKQYVFIDSLRKIYKIILEKYNVENVYILCYYVSEMYAMNLAASDLGISNWDIQHGGQGSLHPAYANFNHIPPSGYKLLPKYFWCWDNYSALEITKWAQNQAYHKVEVKGNPWVEYVSKNLSSEIDEERQIILYTLQPLNDNILDPYIIKTISKTPDNFIWWLRLHPRQLEQKQKLISILKVNNIFHKVEIEKAISLPLPIILNKCIVHISKYSGAILEAYMLKKVTIIISSVGVESFPEVVRSDYSRVVLKESSEELLTEITSLKKNIIQNHSKR